MSATMRIHHVPTIVSLRQLEESGAVTGIPIDWKRSPAAWVSGAVERGLSTPTIVPDTQPLSEAVGASLPLYQYPVAKQPLASLGSVSDDDFLVPGTKCDWELSLAHLPGVDMMVKAGNLHGTKGGFEPPREQVRTTISNNNNCPAAVVPVCAKAAVSRKSGGVRWADLHLPEPFLNGVEDCPISSPPSPSSSEGDSLTYSSTLTSELDWATSPRSTLPTDAAPTTTTTTLATHKRPAPKPRSTLDTLVTALWEDCDSRGLFRYDVSQCATRVVPGTWGWVAQLNEGRSSKKRPTELRVDAVLQPFDSTKFHFGKAFLREVLLQFEGLEGVQALGEAPVPEVGGEMAVRTWSANQLGARVIESNAMTADPTLVMINVSPIDYGHVLLVPRVLSKLPQQLEPQGLGAAFAFTRELANPTFRLGFNSLGAFATINHLHFQGYYLPHRLPCEKAATIPVPDFHHDTLTVSRLADYPVHGWVVEVQRGQDPVACEGEMVALVMQMCGQLQALDQPFNVLMVDQGTRAFIWPQCYAERQAAGLVSEDMLDTGVNPAVFEVAGHLVLKRAEDYDGANDRWAQRLLGGISLPEERFEQLTRMCLKLFERN